MKLARVFLAAVVALVVLILGSAALATLREEGVLFDEDVNQDQAAIGRAVAAGAAETWAHGGRAAAEHLVDEAELAERGGAHEPTMRIELAERPAGAEPYKTKVIGDRLATFAPIEGQTLGVLVSEPRAQRDETLQRAWRRWATFGVFLAIAASTAVLILGSLLIARPIHRIVAHARRIGSGDLTPSVGLEMDNEIGELALEMNRMCAQIAESQGRLATETERRIATLEQLRHADRLGTVGQLAAGIAHELGTPLNVVQGRAQLIAEEAPTPSVVHSAKVIVEQVERMSKIIRQLLDFARRGPTSHDACDVNDVASKTLDLLRTMAKKCDVELAVGPADTPVLARIDQGLLAQVVANLTVNAIHATTGRGGTVFIDVRRADASPPPGVAGGRGPHVAIAIRDQGTGIDPEHLPHIFEPFFTTKDVGHGTGLGLSVSYGIVRDAGGWIQVESELGRGSTFTVWLPIDARPSAGD